MSIVEKYQLQYKKPLTITDEAIETAVYLAQHYFPNEALPRSAFKLIHPSCSLLYQQAKEAALELTCQNIFDHLVSFYKENSEEVINHLYEQKISDHPSNHTIPLSSSLRLYSDNLTNEARLGKISKVQGREKELQIIINSLGKPTCNNILIISPPGTGKTTVVKQLAIKIVEGEVPFYLQDKLFLSLRVSEIKYEIEKFNQLIKDINKYMGKFILFVDEIHMLFEDSLILNQLKPLLSDGKVSLIGATTQEDIGYLKDSALFRRFTILPIGSPSKQESIAMIQAGKNELEKKIEKKWQTTFKISNEAIQAAVNKAAYSHRGHLPASAIEIIEEQSILNIQEGKNQLDSDHIIKKIRYPLIQKSSFFNFFKVCFSTLAQTFHFITNKLNFFKNKKVIKKI